MQIFKNLALGEHPSRPSPSPSPSPSHVSSLPTKSDHIPNALWDLLQHCWARDPSRRPSMKSVAFQMAEIEDEFEEALAREIMELNPEEREGNMVGTRGDEGEGERDGQMRDLERVLRTLKEVEVGVPVKVTLESAVVRIEECKDKVGYGGTEAPKGFHLDRTHSGLAVTVSRAEIEVSQTSSDKSSVPSADPVQQDEPSSHSTTVARLYLVRILTLVVSLAVAFIMCIFVYRIRSVSRFVTGFVHV